MAPSGIVSTGWPAVEATCREKLGIEFDDWQRGAGRLILAKRDDGKLAAMIGGVGMSVCRQVGKTYLIGGMVFGLSVNMPGLLTIWSAHHARTHGETFLSMQAFAKRQRVAPHIAQVFTGSGDEEIRFRNGSRILFGARERGFGRGIPGVDVIVDDEAQIMSDKALDAQLATMNTSKFGLAIFIGTPPRPDDPSEAFTRMRSEAWDGSLRDAAWIEIGAESDANPNDRKVWAKANPSFPHRTPPESIQRLQRKLTAESFLREGLGIWDEMSGGVIAAEQWNALADKDSAPLDPVSFGVYVNLTRTSAAIGVAGRREDGRFHVGIVPAVRGSDMEPPAGTGWIVARVKELVEQWSPCAVVVDGRSAAASLIPALEESGVEVTVTNAGDMARACGTFYDAVVDGQLRHQGAAPLAKAVVSAKRRELADAWAWDRKDKRSDITQLVAVTLALHGLVARPVEQAPEPRMWDWPDEIFEEVDA